VKFQISKDKENILKPSQKGKKMKPRFFYKRRLKRATRFSSTIFDAEDKGKDF
jgi:hypothetical protein